MKKLSSLLLVVMLFLTASAFMPASDTLITRTGHVGFYSHAALEDIKANNYQVSSSLNKKTGDVMYTMLIKSFEFTNAKMGEHFNENYMESDKYPKSTFKGKIADISKVNFSKDGTYNVNAEGELTIHGVTNKVNTPGTITVKGGEVTSNSKFMVALKDYKITVPSAVSQKIAETIEVTVDVTYPNK